MKSNSTSFLHSQEKIIKQPLISSLYDSSPQNQTIDVMKLMSKQQQSRVTKVDIKSYRSIARGIPNNTLLHQKSVLQNMNEPQEEQTQNVKPKKQREIFLQNRTTQTFLSNYENNSLFGFALYLAFMAFISAQVLTSIYFASQSQNIAFYKNKGILFILFSELVYYLIMRVLNTKVSIKIYTQSSILHSLKNILLSSPNNKVQKDSENSLTKFFKRNPSITIAITIVSILSSQIIYYRIATQVSMLFEKGSIDLISTLFWSNFIVPVLVRHICMNQERSWKMQILPYLLGVFVLSLLFQSIFAVVLATLKVLQAYLQSILGVQMFHINQLTKIVLLIILGTLNIVYILRGDSEDVFKQNILKECVIFCVELAAITLSFILSRVIAAVYLKNQLHRYFYTQSHIILAYLFTTILMYSTYLSFTLWHSLLAISLLLVIGVIIYLEGKQKEELTIQISLEEQQT